MKCCNKKTKSPLCLQDDMGSLDWNSFRNEKQNCYNEVVESLTSNQSGLCAYCECSTTENNHSVEHFLPKSSFEKLTFDWENLYLTCRESASSVDASCNSKKSNLNPQGKVINPKDIPAYPCLFSVGLSDGELKIQEEACKEANIDIGLIESSIEHLGLNCERLKQARLRVVNSVNSFIKALIAKNQSGQQLIESLCKRYFGGISNGKMEQFFTTIRGFLIYQALKINSSDLVDNYLRRVGY